MAFRVWVFLVLALASDRPSHGAGLDEPVPASRPSPPISIYLNAPSDLDAFWKRVDRPDLVILDGALYRQLRQAGEVARPIAPAAGAVVEALTVRGEVSGDWARLVAEYRVTLSSDGPVWVALRLDGLTLTDVREGPTELPTRTGEEGAWQAELKGRGLHVIQVALTAPVRSLTDGRRLGLTIPTAASTRFDLTVPGRVRDAETSPTEPVVFSEGEEGKTRLAGRLGPRPRLELSWHDRVDPSVEVPPLLSAQGEIFLDVERGSIRSRSSWVVGSIRGTIAQLLFRIDQAEEILEVEVDHRPVPWEIRPEAGRSVVKVALSDPLRPNTTRTMTINTRRSIAFQTVARVVLQGCSFDQAKVQTGVVAIARTGSLFLNPTPGRGLRRIDPRTELPESLRARPDTTLAFEFNDQPFDLVLGVEPTPSRLRIDGRTTLLVEPRLVRVRTRLECRASQERIFEVKIRLPKGLEYEGAEPADVVESAQIVPLEPKSPTTPGVSSARLLTLTLTPQARDSDSFSLLLKGWAGVDPSGPVAVPLFQPEVETGVGGRFAVVTERNVSAELPAATDELPPFRVDWGTPPADWVWPDRRPGPDLGLTWLRSETNPDFLPLRMTVRSRAIRHESTLHASVDLQGVEVVEEISGEVAHGSFSRLDLALPAEIPSRWEVEGLEMAGREPLGQDLDGTRRYRLRFAREVTESFRFRIRYRIGSEKPVGAGRELRYSVAATRVLEGVSNSQKFWISAEPGQEVQATGRGWSPSQVADAVFVPTRPGESGPPVRLILARTSEEVGPVALIVSTSARVELPPVVVSRLWLRIIQQPDETLASTAEMRVEARDGSIVVGLPPGSRWVRARVGDLELDGTAIERVATDEYRLRLPGSAPASLFRLVLDYVGPAPVRSSGLPALRLLGGGIVQQSMVEIQINRSRAAVGTPRGWLDENEWFWSGWVWKRRPTRSVLELRNWVGLNVGSTRLEPVPTPLGNEASDRQSYLFSQTGLAESIELRVFSRLTLVLLCSGPVLGLGLLILARRPPSRVVASVMLVLGFAGGLWFEPNVLFLMLQSSSLGFVLWASALAMHWGIERRGIKRKPADLGLVVGPVPPSSPPFTGVPVGSDESTAIRPRPPTLDAVSTADHVFVLRPTFTDRGSARFSELPPEPEPEAP